MKKKLSVLLAFAMMLTMLTACGGQTGSPDNGMDYENGYNENEQGMGGTVVVPNPGQDGTSNENTQQKIEGTFWLLATAEVANGLYLAEDGSYVWVESAEYGYYASEKGTYTLESTRDSYDDIGYEDGTIYTYMLLNEYGNEFLDVEIRLKYDGTVWNEFYSEPYTAVSKEIFEATCKITVEDTQKPDDTQKPGTETQKWSQPFMGKYFVGEHLGGGMVGIYMDETYMYETYSYVGKQEPVKYTFEKRGEGLYFISYIYGDNGDEYEDDFEDGYWYDANTGVLEMYNGYDGATLAELRVSDKATYDKIQTN